jgi:hypothetical protein
MRNFVNRRCFHRHVCAGLFAVMMRLHRIWLHYLKAHLVLLRHFGSIENTNIDKRLTPKLKSQIDAQTPRQLHSGWAVVATIAVRPYAEDLSLKGQSELRAKSCRGRLPRLPANPEFESSTRNGIAALPYTERWRSHCVVAKSREQP